MPRDPVAVESEEFIEAMEAYQGWCVSCGEFTTGGVEPDARQYTCETCGRADVYGAEEALIDGYITIDAEGAA